MQSEMRAQMAAILDPLGLRVRELRLSDEASFRALCVSAAAIGGLDHLAEHFALYATEQNRLNAVAVDSNDRIVRTVASSIIHS